MARAIVGEIIHGHDLDTLAGLLSADRLKYRRPGAALNKAIDACSGSAVVILSAHAIPWLRS